MFVFISDLHLGEGSALEDFALWSQPLPRSKTPQSIHPFVQAIYPRWRRFLQSLTAATHPSSDPPELVLLGDTFDLLQVQGALCDPDKITRIANAHPVWFEALHDAHRQGLRISLVVGNHDHELLHRDVWSLLLRHLPFLNEAHGGTPLSAWCDPTRALHAEHGSQFDPTNAVPDFNDPAALSLGSYVVLGIVNAFEPRCPLLDLMPDVPTALWYALARAPGLLASPLRSFLFHTADPNQPPPNLDFLPELEHLLIRTWLREMPRPYRRRLRQTLRFLSRVLHTAPDSGSHPMTNIHSAFDRRRFALSRGIDQRLIPTPIQTPSDPPTPLRILITGHTHRARVHRRRDGIQWVNTGSWKARAIPKGRNRFHIEQPLDVTRIQKNGEVFQVEQTSALSL